MAHRTLTDADGRSWHVFDVMPRARPIGEGETSPAPDRRAGLERRQEPYEPAALDRRFGERRQDAPRAILPGDLARGWLCFETHGEKRRLAPVPEGWATLGDAALLALLERADRVPQRLIELAAARARSRRG